MYCIVRHPEHISKENLENKLLMIMYGKPLTVDHLREARGLSPPVTLKAPYLVFNYFRAVY